MKEENILTINKAVIYGIYFTDCEIYIGQSISHKIRISKHILNLRKRNHKNSKLQQAWDFYGEEKFIVEILEILENCTKDQLTICEIKWINYYKKYGAVYNLMIPENSCAGFKHSDQTRKKMSEITKSQSHSAETRKKISDSSKKLWQDAEFRKKMMSATEIRSKDPTVQKKNSDSRKINWQDQEYRKKFNESSRWGDPEFRAGQKAKKAATIARKKAALAPINE